MKAKTIVSVLAVSVIAVLLIGIFGTRPSATQEILYEGDTIDVFVAKDPIAYRRGLSGLSLADMKAKRADGMLFVYPDAKERTFWMNEMEFDLDVVWIRDKQVKKIERNIPAPSGGEEPTRFYSMPYKVDAVLELPAGGADKFGFVVGTSFTSLLDE